MASSGRRFHKTCEGARHSLESPPIWEAPYSLLSQQYPPKVAAVVVPRHLQLVRGSRPLSQFPHEVHALVVPQGLQLVQGLCPLNQGLPNFFACDPFPIVTNFHGLFMCFALKLKNCQNLLLLNTKKQTNNNIYKDQQYGLFSEMHGSIFLHSKSNLGSIFVSAGLIAVSMSSMRA